MVKQERLQLPQTLQAQYLAVKRAYPDALVFIRLGDFYEAFGEDAVTAARALDLTLARGMTGFIVSQAPRYAEQLTAQGYRVALVDQVKGEA